MAYDRHARDLPMLGVGSQVTLQNHATGLWDRHGVVTDIGPHRRYFIRLPSGRVLTRNRRHLRQRYAHAQSDPAEPATPAQADWMPRRAGPSNTDTAPPQPQPPPATPEPELPFAAPRRSQRLRRRPQRLIETM